MKYFQFESLDKDQLISLAKQSLGCLIAADDILRAIKDNRLAEVQKLINVYDIELDHLDSITKLYSTGFRTKLN